jgi:hypothetical protein
VSSSCYVKRVVPFVLTFILGAALWQAFGERRRVPQVVTYVEYETRVLDLGGDYGPRRHARPEGEGSRTWLVIRSTGAELRGVNRATCDGCSVRMRVLFGEDGAAVPGNGFSLSPSSYPLIGEAVAAARGIKFAPATRNGRPVPVWANVTYVCAAEESRPHANAYRNLCSLTVERNSGRTWDGRPWRVVTPNE